jgi:hypothetical protein
MRKAAMTVFASELGTAVGRGRRNESPSRLRTAGASPHWDAVGLADEVQRSQP